MPLVPAKLNAFRFLLVSLCFGLLAGLCTAGFHAVFSQPLLDQAIALEETKETSNHHNHSHNTEKEIEKTSNAPTITRSAQKMGAFLGWGLNGLSWATTFATAYVLVAYWFANISKSKLALGLALLLMWSLAVLPALKYPAMLPGVGSSDTLAYRQNLYFGSIGLSLAVSILSVWLAKSVYERSTLGPLGSVVLALFCMAMGNIAIYWFMPNSTDDSSALPLYLVNNFSYLSLAGQVVFWMLFAGGICLFLQHQNPQQKRND